MLVTAVVAVIAAARHGSSSPTAASPHDTATVTLAGPPGPEGIDLEQGRVLAPISGAATGQTVGGVECNSMEQAAFHIHSRLTVYIDGVLRPIPAGIWRSRAGHGCERPRLRSDGRRPPRWPRAGRVRARLTPEAMATPVEVSD